ncbi:hypothetical protein BC829DRAFT_384082 [Chytridium lagenaria]|nr:hypothetical protein BC829DRAFT_384082 [Chytridium lagenaria]
MPDILGLCLGDTPDKAFSVFIDPTTTISRLRSLLAPCTRHNPAELNLFAVHTAAQLSLDDKRIYRFLTASARIIPHLPVTWLKDPTALVSTFFMNDDDTLKENSRNLRLIVALDARVVAFPVAPVAGTPVAVNNGRTLHPPAYGMTLGEPRPPERGSSRNGPPQFLVKADDVPEKIMIKNGGETDGILPLSSGRLFGGTAMDVKDVQMDGMNENQGKHGVADRLLTFVDSKWFIVNASSATFNQNGATPSTEFLQITQSTNKPGESWSNERLQETSTNQGNDDVNGGPAKQFVNPNKRRRIIIIAIISVVALVVVGLGVGLGVGLSSSQSNSYTPSPSPRSSYPKASSAISSPLNGRLWWMIPCNVLLISSLLF